MLTEPLRKGAESIELVSGEGAVEVRYSVDGVSYTGSRLDKRVVAQAIGLLKQTLGMDVNEKRKPQTATMKVTLDGKKREMVLETAGSAGGETAKLLVDPKKRHNLRLEELGFTTDQQDLIKNLIIDGTGIVIVAAPPQQGLTSAMYGIIRSHDAFLTHILSIEREAEQDLEGITQNKLLPTASRAEEVQQVNWVISQEPDTLLIDRIEDPKSAVAVINFSKQKRAYIGMRAASAVDALSQWRRLIGDDKGAMKYLKLVICGRLVRKLCDACKVGYHPDPETLRKLSIDPDRVGQLFQARTQPMRDQKGNPVPCTFCHDLHYKGRFGVFETLLIDDDVRQVVLAGGSVNQLRAVYRKQRGKYLQEQGLAHVEQGETSVQELLRVLRIGEAPPGAPRAATAPGRTPAKPSAQ
jgi:general secretion pathway protein E